MDLFRPKAPSIPAPVVMPTANDADVLAARKQAMAQQAALSGRASTILSQQNQSDKLGG